MSRQPLDVRQIPLHGTHLIEASAGTGKTYTITSLFVRLIAEGVCTLDQIAAVTFTNAATAELMERVQRRLTDVTQALAQGKVPEGDALGDYLLALPQPELVVRRLDFARSVVDRTAIFTIHGFAARMLAQYAFESGVRSDTELLLDDRGILYDVVTDFWASEVASLPRDHFRALGADAQHRPFASVARTVSGAVGVALAAVPPKPDLEARLREYGESFRLVQAELGAKWESLCQLLLSSSALNRSKYRVPGLAREATALRAYFDLAEPSPTQYPDLEKGRWTRSRVQAGTKKGMAPPEHALLGLLEDHWEAACGVALAAAELGAYLRGRLAVQVEARLLREHGDAHTQSFDGLLLGLRDALAGPLGEALARAIRHRFPTVLIDEFQDTDPVQYDIFRRIYSGGKGKEPRPLGLYLIGDPKQSIYRFRGADIQTYLAASQHAGRAIWTLRTSYRSSPRVVAAQNALWGPLERPFACPDIRYEEISARDGAENRFLTAAGDLEAGLKIVLASAKESANMDVLVLAACEVARLLASGSTIDGEPVSPRHIAVLTRTNRQAEVIQGHLRALSIPAVMHGDRSVFESPEAIELRRVLVALSEPSDRGHSRSALATRMLGVTSGELLRMKQDAELLELWTGRLRALSDLWRTRGIAHALESLWKTVDLVPRTLRDADGERRLTNFRHLLELLHDAETRAHLGVVGLLRFFETAIAAPTGHAMAPEARQVRLESDEDAVVLTTAHKSKGLEYDIVVLPSIGIKDSPGSHAAVRYHEPDGEVRVEVRAKESEEAAPHFAVSDQEEFEESLRVGYVALTRAKHQVIALYDPKASPSSLGWFLHEPRIRAWSQLRPGDALKEIGLEQKLEDLAALCVRSAGAVTTCDGSNGAVLDSAPVFRRPGDTGVSLVPSPAPPQPSASSRTSSFSAMTRDAAGLGRQAQGGRDVDEVDAPPAAEPGLRGVSPRRILLAEFPRGAGPGDALHAIFERVPFAEGDAEARREIVREVLLTRGFGLEHVAAVASSVEAVLSVRLAPLDFRLGSLGRAARVAEMEFGFRVGDKDSPLSGHALLRALSKAGEDPYLTPGYLARVRDLGFGAFHGLLRGFIDLVFTVDERFYLLDYKSNFLGETSGDYGPSSLAVAMEDHHYLLQGLLYAVAVHRYGRVRMAGYDFERNFGGVFYVFLRGIEPDAEPESGRGIYFFRPSQALLERLSAGLAEGAR